MKRANLIMIGLTLLVIVISAIACARNNPVPQTPETLSPAVAPEVPKPEPPPAPLIQMAILLDTSGSMEGLIEQAKTQLWKIVNELSLAKKSGVSPRMEVALYEYGKDSIPVSENYLRMIVPLTMDLDQISEELFKLQTNGGSEFCGTVIDSASRGLKWDSDPNTLKVIFIAGNEPFTQGSIDYRVSCKSAITNGIIVNTIFCGNSAEGIATNWKDGADISDGKYLFIDQNMAIEYIPAPQDEEILKLGQQLNDTYISYGKSGISKKERQVAQDMNAASVNSTVSVQRAVTKASKNYVNQDWDLIDAEQKGKLKIDQIPESDLPEEMKKMDKTQRKDYLEKKKKDRSEIQSQINTLQNEREKYVTEQRKNSAEKNTLDEAIIKTIRTQAEQKNFNFEKK